VDSCPLIRARSKGENIRLSVAFESAHKQISPEKAPRISREIGRLRHSTLKSRSIVALVAFLRQQFYLQPFHIFVQEAISSISYWKEARREKLLLFCFHPLQSLIWVPIVEVKPKPWLFEDLKVKGSRELHSEQEIEHPNAQRRPAIHAGI
jgi:hypothetical protein